MSASARRSLATDVAVARNERADGAGTAISNELRGEAGPDSGGVPEAKLSVIVAADNRLLREALARMLAKKGDVEVTGLEATAPLRAESVAQTNANVLLLTSRGALHEDLHMIQQVRGSAEDAHPAAREGQGRRRIPAVRARRNKGIPAA
jgi:hypothetical protein